MDTPETKLFEAAAKGNINSLQKLLKDDPLILDRVVVNCFSETPLHVAALLGHTDFVKEIIKAKPEFTSDQLNPHQSSPLHLASAKGHIDVVEALLSVETRTCLARDKNGLTPVHLAALKGRVEVMKILLREKPEAARVTTCRGENILHLCVKQYQMEPLKLLVTTIGDPAFVNSKDVDGNTVLHLAVADKQVETINFLLTVDVIEVNATNINGMTPLDVLIKSRRDVRDSEIEESLRNAGVTGTNILSQSDSSPSTNNRWKNLLGQQDDWLEKKKSALMIVASLIATMAFQAGVDPPSGVWQDDKSVDSLGERLAYPRKAGFSVMAYNSPYAYLIFSSINTIGFIASLSIILLLMSGFPIRRRLFMRILIVITWIAITAIGVSYSISVTMVTPSVVPFSFIIEFITIHIWVGFMGLLVVGHTIRLVVRTVKKRRTMRMIDTSGSSEVQLNNVGV
ncbi:hypothetical protein ABFS83_03G042700 [Erythranthe nasuta]